MLSPDQLALFEWFQQSGRTAYQEERWLFRQYGVLTIIRLTDQQAREALARLQREAA
jgi:hypothetical protein